MERDFKGVWIPSELWLNSDLKIMEKIFLVEISSLDGVDGCYASNGYFSEFFNLSKTRCSAIIQSLKAKGYITIKRFYENSNKTSERRVIKVNENAIKSNTSRSLGNVSKGIKPKEIDENIEKGSDVNSNEDEQQLKVDIDNKNSESGEVTGQAIDGKTELIEDMKKTKGNPIYVEVITYLNNVCGTAYKHTTTKNQRFINARIKEGYSLDDFKNVIDKKREEWLGTNMSKYLRPETLFGTKFERYINEIQMKLSEGGKDNDWKLRGVKNNRENKSCGEEARSSRWSRGENTDNRSLTEEERELAKRELF